MTEPVCKVCGRPFESTDKVREAEGICAGCATPPAEREPFEDNIAIEQRRSDILEEIRAERLRQIGKGGTTKTRDQHWNAADWYEMISDYNAWARRMWAMGSLHKARRRLIQTAALAVAAVEALDAVHIPHIQQILELVKGLTTPSPCGDHVPCERGQEPPIRDINYTMQKLEEAQERIAELQVSEKRANVYVGLASQTAGQCRDLYNKTVPEKFEGTTVLGMFMVVCEAVKEAREEVFDLYHQACLVHPNSSEDPVREFQYDNQCMSTYESIEEKLIEWGLLKPEQCLRRKE